MRKHCSRIVWGFVLELFDLRFNHFDVLPDILGFALILIGLSGIASSGRGFAIAKVMAFLLLADSGLSFFAGETATTMNLAAGGVGGGALFGQLYAFSVMAVSMLLTYGVASGFGAMAATRGKQELETSFRHAWNATFAIGAILLFVYPFAIYGSNGGMGPLVFVLTISLILVTIWLLFLIRRAGRELDGPDGSERLGQHIDLNG